MRTQGTGFGFIMLLLLKELRVGGDDVFMAEKAFFHVRKARMLRPLHIGMAEPAVDGLNPGMDPVAERNGLLRPDPLPG